MYENITNVSFNKYKYIIISEINIKTYREKYRDIWDELTKR